MSKEAKIRVAFERVDLEELATEMVDRHGIFDACLVYDPETESFDVIVESSSTHTPGLYYIARLRTGWNDLTETDEALEKFFEDVPTEKFEETAKCINGAENIDEISKIMKKTTGHDYAYYERLALIHSVQEWIEIEINKFIKDYGLED